MWRYRERCLSDCGHGSVFQLCHLRCFPRTSYTVISSSAVYDFSLFKGINSMSLGDLAS